MRFITPAQVISSEAQTHSATVVSTNPVYLSMDIAERIAVTIQNTISSIYVKLGDNASSTDFSYFLPSNGVLEITYSGVITAIAVDSPSTVMITEEY